MPELPIDPTAQLISHTLDQLRENHKETLHRFAEVREEVREIRREIRDKADTAIVERHLQRLERRLTEMAGGDAERPSLARLSSSVAQARWQLAALLTGIFAAMTALAWWATNGFPMP